MFSRLPAFFAFAFAALPMSPAEEFSVRLPLLEGVIREEMRQWEIGGVAVALVDGPEVIYAAGFGEAQRDSIFRCGSISKLFNAIAVMQQVEAGKLDLDAPLQTYGAGLLPLNPFPDAPAITLRHLLCHRSGLQREATVGGYFDSTQPSLTATVASIASGVLATRPGEKTRYSNFAASIAGHVVERVTGQSFEDSQRAGLLDPLGMKDSAWTLAKTARARIVVSHLRVADGHGGWMRREAPLFDLGTIPAGNLFSTAGDVARFASALLANDGRLVQPKTLAEMWRPQLTPDAAGFGLGFLVGKFREHRAISHSGAVYGHSTSLVVLQDTGLAVVVLANEDIVNGRVHRISDAALSLLLETKRGEPPPAPIASLPVGNLSAFAGDYEAQSFWARLEVRDGQLTGNLAGQHTKFTAHAALEFIADSRLEDATPVFFERDAAGKISGFKLGAQHFHRAPAASAPLPPEWRAFLGSYGPECIPLIVSERHGHLYAMTENMVDYRLTPLNKNVCTLPPGMYSDEQIVFLTDAEGRPRAVNFANMLLPRRE